MVFIFLCTCIFGVRKAVFLRNFVRDKSLAGQSALQLIPVTIGQYVMRFMTSRVVSLHIPTCLQICFCIILSYPRDKLYQGQFISRKTHSEHNLCRKRNNKYYGAHYFYNIIMKEEGWYTDLPNYSNKGCKGQGWI